MQSWRVREGAAPRSVSFEASVALQEGARYLMNGCYIVLRDSIGGKPWTAWWSLRCAGRGGVL